jgi:hypothetical protein
VVAPSLAARCTDPRRGALRMVAYLLAFHLAYVAWVALVHAARAVPAPR